MCRLYILLSILACSLFAQQPKLNIAVNDLNAEGIDSSSAKIISDRIRSELINIGVFRVMERTEMHSILKELGFQQTGVCDESCIVEVGQLLGVERMVAGSIGKVGSFYTISLRMINVATGEILYSVNEDCECTIKEVISQAAINIAIKLAKGTGVEVKKPSVKGKTGDIYISSNILGAFIEIDGKSSPGETPLTLKNFPAGEHRIIVRKDKWYGSEKVNLKPDDLLRVNVMMKQGSSMLNVFSEPVGVNIFIDGKAYGKTPHEIKNIPAGEHSVSLKKQGYTTVVSNVLLNAEESQSLSFSLKPIAYISVETQVKEALIIVNGNKAGRGDIQNYPVEVGTVSIQIESPGYDVLKEKFDIGHEEHRVIKRELVSIFGTLIVSSKPHGVFVLINGKKAGTTTYENNKLTPEKYQIELIAENYEEIREYIVIKKNEILQKNYILKPSKELLKVKKRIQWFRRIVFGAVAVGFFGAGVYYNVEVDKFYDAYCESKSSNLSDHEENWNEVKRNLRIRNIMYGLSGACTVGFAISIPF